MACRWGWGNQAYIEGVLTEFRAGHFPADAFISDFEWFTARPDYTLPPQGDPEYHDFLFNNITFPDPAASYVAHYRNDLNFRFGGIRKPRLGNSALLVNAQQMGWLMGQGGDPNGTPNGSRNTNYTDLTFREWYSHQDDLFLRSGVRFFWNDEGEVREKIFTPLRVVTYARRHAPPPPLPPPNNPTTGRLFYFYRLVAFANRRAARVQLHAAVLFNQSRLFSRRVENRGHRMDGRHFAAVAGPAAHAGIRAQLGPRGRPLCDLRHRRL